jgi:hypothetical protein
MLRGNLSTRPFYNDRLVHLVLALIALVVLIVTVVNVATLVRLSRQNTTLSSRIRDDRTAADDFSRKARATRQGIDQAALKVVVAAAREANTLIDGRTFSWTEFFNYIETTMPPDVMLASVRPAIEDTGTKVTMIVIARRAADIDEFLEGLEATGAFEKGLPRQRRQSDNNLEEATIEIMYVPELAHADPKEQAAPAPAAPKPPAGAKGASR